MPADQKDDDNHRLFRQAIGKVRPIRQDRAVPRRPRRPPVPEQTLRDQREVIASLLSGDDGPAEAETETGEELLFARAGLQHTVLRKLRRGVYAVEAELDLHGATVANARELLAHFIHQAQRDGKRCVRIVHGKGMRSAGRLPVLKSKVNAWLRRKDEVLAFCSARPHDGGTGALYVLLKRRG